MTHAELETLQAKIKRLKDVVQLRVVALEQRALAKNSHVSNIDSTAAPLHRTSKSRVNSKNTSFRKEPWLLRSFRILVSRIFGRKL